MNIPSYSDVLTVGSPGLVGLFDEPVLVQEKIDGSQLSFGVLDDGLHIRSKGKEIVLDYPDGMFAKGVDYLRSIQDRMIPGWIYRAEYLSKPKHNTLTYGRIPKNNLVLFDADSGFQNYQTLSCLASEATKLDIDYVGFLYYGPVKSTSDIDHLLHRESMLGGTKVEGIVIKNYFRFTRDKKIMMGKMVREDFKELNRIEFRKANPSHGDVIQVLIARYKNENRWRKAIQHLRDSGRLEHSPRDIGSLLKEIDVDIIKECSEEIKEYLYAWAISKILRGSKAGFAEWYKEKILKNE